MLNLSKSDVKLEPFPHAMSTAMIEPSVYAGLRTDYPDYSIFQGQKDTMGAVGSRTGQGFDIYRGDPAYDKLIQSSTAWREFDEYINSRTFINKFLELFGDHLDSMGCAASISPESYDRSLIEPRETMTPNRTLGDRLHDFQKKFLGTRRGIPAKLFTRLDIHKALSGYEKRVHCDRPNRLCSLVIYFCDADKINLEGGELTIHAHKKKKAMRDYERHPDPAMAPVVATVRPRENHGLLFPCCNNSYHGVTAVRSKNAERDYLYINISGEAPSLWV